MNNLISSNKLTMNSLEISELTGKRHDHVMRDIITMLTALHGDKGVPSFKDTYIHNQNGQRYPLFNLPKRETLILVSGYSVIVRAKIIDRWQELESQQKPLIPQTYSAALLEAGRLALENEQQAEQLRIAAPKVEFVDKFVTSSTGSMGFREVAKLLKIKEPEFRLFLSECKIMYRLGGNYVPYQHHIEAGRFEIKAGVSDSDHAYKQAKFTAKGVEWVAGLIAVYRVNQELKGDKNAMV